ncbi:transcriptional regulator [Bifidobacterium simiarum]|uniref:Transcriptional regulator n=2 Tax=Bifidobacterium simiarum TaxID=2045441 RepID=A0A2M9HCM4_9BIFI|nr:transcriptional regulator [Bifidobacterium simiarum]
MAFDERDGDTDRTGNDAASGRACDGPIRSLEILNECIPLFETLKDPNRQRLLVQLVCGGPQTVGELCESSTLSRTAVSHHIKLLAQAGFIDVAKEATRRICTARADRWLPLLDELAAALKADLAAAEAERTER